MVKLQINCNNITFFWCRRNHVIDMTANAFDEDRKQALKCGMDGFLSKPIVMEELIRTLQNNMM